MQPIDFEFYAKICGATAIFTFLGLACTFTKSFSELLDKKAKIEGKRLPDPQFPNKKRQFPSCVEKALKRTSKTGWITSVMLIGGISIISLIIYYLCKGVSVPYGKEYIIFISVLSYLTSFGNLIWLAILVFSFISRSSKLSQYEGEKDLYTYKCK